MKTTFEWIHNSAQNSWRAVGDAYDGRAWSANVWLGQGFDWKYELSHVDLTVSGAREEGGGYLSRAEAQCEAERVLTPYIKGEKDPESDFMKKSRAILESRNYI